MLNKIMDLQARLYWRLIRMNMDKDPYYKDFKLLDYRFIVVNRKTVIPLVWEFNKTQMIGQIDLDTPSGYKYHLRDPYVIGAEIHRYLTETPRVPFNVFEDRPNNIVEFIKNN